MAEVSITGEDLVITLKGIRKIGAFKSELTIPLANVRGVTADAGLPTGWPGFTKAPEWPGRKVLGTDFYGRYLGGTFVQDGDRVFWDVADPERAIVITLDDVEFKRLYIEVDNPDQTVLSIETALSQR
ncbi:MAG: hypothetical protein ACK5KO_11620 [Arachnia sp.]